jgi:hypothetical protein
MNKASSIYFIFAALFVAGLWFILGFGSTLVPPPDLAGKWELSTASETQGSADRSSLTIEQSGKFLSLAVGNSPPVQLTLLDESPSGNPLSTIYRFTNPAHRLIVEGTPNSDLLNFTLTGPTAFTGEGGGPRRAPATPPDPPPP